jgi:SAM-dependent methyltransferase
MPEVKPPAPPPEYYRGAARRTHQRRRLQALLALTAQTQGRLLDYGCGYGELTWELSRTHDVTGVDLNPERLRFAQREYAPVPFAVCRPDGLDFPDASFDVVTSVVVLPFVRDYARYLAECHRVLRPGGHLVLMMANGNDLRSTIARRIGIGSTNRHLERREVERLVDEAGFTIVAESAYFDSFADNMKNAGDVLLNLANLPLRLLGVRRFASYYALLLRLA